MNRLLLNKVIIFVFILLLVIVGLSFAQYMIPRYSKSQDLLFEKIEQNCKKNQTSNICTSVGINNLETYNRFMKYDSRVTRKKLDQITLSSEIINNSLFSFLGMLLPMIISLIVILTIAIEIKSGFYQFIFFRENYRKFILTIIKKIIHISFLVPFILVILYIISGLLTNFNSIISEYNKSISVYDTFKENYYIVSIILNILLTFLISILYGIISFLCSLKEKSIVVSIVKSYLVCVIIAFFDYYFLNIIANKILDLKINVLTFNILSYSQFNGEMNIVGILVNIIILYFIIIFYFIIKYKRKDMLYEQIAKQNSNI